MTVIEIERKTLEKGGYIAVAMIIPFVIAFFLHFAYPGVVEVMSKVMSNPFIGYSYSITLALLAGFAWLERLTR